MNALALLRHGLVVGVVSLVGILQAQSVTTTPVGAVSRDVPVGLIDLGVTLVNRAILTASVASSTGVQLTVNGVESAGALLVSDQPYYIEFVDGYREGERFEVDVSATILSGNNTITIKADDKLNTLPSMEGLALAGSRLVLRKHVTLKQISASAAPAFVGNNTAALADQIWIFDPETQQFVVHFLRADGTTWRQAGTTITTSDLPIAPGTGLLVNKTGASTTITFAGEVRVNDFLYKFPAGLSFHAGPAPIAYSPVSFGGAGVNGWTGSNNAGLADQIWTFDPGGGNFATHYLRGDGLEWRVSGKTTNVSFSEIISGSGAFMVKRNVPDAEYILTSSL